MIARVLAMAFEGCACRAAFHAGVAAALADAGVRPDITAGASSGSIVAVGVAAGRAKELPARWRALAGRAILAPRRTLANRSPFDMSAIVRGALVDALGALDLRASPTEALVTATRVRPLARVVFSSRDEPDLLAPVLGSCFIPVIYGRWVTHGGRVLLDGGLTDNLPVEAAVERGAKDVIAVVTSPDGLALKSATRWRWRPEARGARVHVVRPRAPLAIGSWDFDADRIARAIDEGYARGREFAGG